MKERIERLIQVAKERGELHSGTAWDELKDSLKRCATKEEEKIIDDAWMLAEREEYLAKWDEDFLLAISGEYKTQREYAKEYEAQKMQMQQLYQQQKYQNAMQAHGAGAGTIYPVTSTNTSSAGLFGNLFGGAGK
jgi:hypothetical protein